MLIQLPGADFSGAGLGQVTRLISGMPEADLAGLWLFDEGDDGDTITVVTDRSGHGRHAALKSGWTGGKKRSYGMQVDNRDGTKLESTLRLNPAGQAQTIFVSGANMLPGSEAGVYNTWVGSTGNDPAIAPDGGMTNGPALAITANGTTSIPSTLVYDVGSDVIGTFALLLPAYPGFGAPGMWAFDIDAANDTVKLHGLGKTTVSATDEGVGAYYDGGSDRGYLTIGAWAHGATRSANTTIARVYAVAAYNRTFTQAQAQAHMAYMQTLLAARGLTFS